MTTIVEIAANPDDPAARAPVDRVGFTRRWGMNASWSRGAPWLSLGVHFDWHTPTLDLHIGKGWLQIGRNQWEGVGRFSVYVGRFDGHTDQCSHFMVTERTEP